MKHLISFLIVLSLLVGCGTTTEGPVPADTSAPVSPIGLNARAGDREVELMWQANAEPDLSHYRLFYGKQSGNLDEAQNIDKATSEVVVGELENGATYFFALAAVDESGNASPLSEEVSATPLAPQVPGDKPGVGDEPPGDTPGDDVPNDEPGEGDTPPSDSPGDKPGDEPSDDKPSDDKPSDNPPVDEPGDDKPGDEPPADTPGDEPGDKPLPEDPPGEDPPGEAPPADEPPAEDPPADEPPSEEPQPAAPIIESVSVESNGGSNQLRQGFGEFILKVEGDHLNDIASAHLEGPSASSVAPSPKIALSVIESSQKSARLKGIVAHGQTATKYGLILKTSKQDVFGNALRVTRIQAAPAGSDAAGRGTFDKPFRSLTKAVSVAKNGDQIELANGDYSPSYGEKLPLGVSEMDIRGVGEKVRFYGEGFSGACLIGHNYKKGVKLHNLWVEGCAFGIGLNGDKSTFTAVRFVDNTTGIHLSNQAELVIEQSLIGFNKDVGIEAGWNSSLTFAGEQNTIVRKNGEAGLHVTGSAKVTGHNAYLTQNKYGLYVNGSGTSVDLKGSYINGNTSHGVLIENALDVNLDSPTVSNNAAHGVNISGPAKIRLKDFRAALNVGDAINVNVKSSDVAALTIIDSTLEKNGESGIEFRSEHKDSALKIRGTTIRDNKTFGLYLAGKPSKIDLGNPLDRGNNLLRDNGATHIYLIDARDAGSGSIPAVGTAFAKDGILHKEVGVHLGPKAKAPYFQIMNVGNNIGFGSP